MNVTRQEKVKGQFVHIVYFWLKEPDNDTSKKAFQDSLEKFVNGSEHIASVFIGSPADTDRPVIDASYTFSLLVTFDSREAHDLYQTEQVHLTFIDESSHLWEKVQVYDSIPA